MKRILTLTAVLSLALMPYRAQAATATAAATTDIVPAIAITKVNDLRFGAVAAGASVGTVVMSPAGARSKTGGVTLSNVNSGGAGSFTITGYSTSTYSITLPSAAVTITDGGVNNMTVDTFLSTPSGTGTLTAGTQTLTVGATLNVGVSQVAGSYTGNYSVSVDYN